MAKRRVTYDITRGHLGADVARLQKTLNAATGSGLKVDGVYGALTSAAIRQLQLQYGLAADGQCTGATLTKLRDLGFPAIEFEVGDGNEGWNWPRKPNPTRLQQPTSSITRSIFGDFQFRHAPISSNPQRIEILGDWVQKNIVTIHVPQLIGVPIPIDDAHAVLSDGSMQCHRLASDLVLKLFAAWEDAGLADRVLTYYGAYNPRLKRKKFDPKPENLSNHSWGTAFDITAKQNWLGQMPAVMGQRGCVRELVSLANDLGIYWGGHFGGETSVSSRDGMHFEVGKL